MKRVFSSKQKRKQAEDTIIREMVHIQKKLEDHRIKQETKVDKEKIMSVLTKFLKLKSETKIH